MWNRIRKFCKDSETIAWAYAQSAIGFLALAVTYVDPALVMAVIPPKYAMAGSVFLLLNGIATKYLRERRDPEMKGKP